MEQIDKYDYDCDCDYDIDIDKLNEYMKWDSIYIEIDLNLGSEKFECYTCDFTNDYIDINADYKNSTWNYKITYYFNTMIKYNLQCENKHEFESWFSNSQEFDRLKKKIY